jgi:ankyrin repeat protein
MRMRKAFALACASITDAAFAWPYALKRQRLVRLQTPKLFAGVTAAFPRAAGSTLLQDNLMKRSHSVTERTTVRPHIPPTSRHPGPGAQQALGGPVADAPVAPAATEEHAPMAFPGPFAHVPRPPAMQHGAMQASSTGTAVAGQEGVGQNPVVPGSTSTTSGASATAIDATNGNPHQLPPLILAACNGNLADLDVLLQDRSTDINQVDSKFGLSALIAAAARGHVKGLARLIAAGADIDLVSPQLRMTALSMASRRNKPDAIACLLDAGAHVSLAAGAQRRNALSIAAVGGHIEVVKLLLAHKGIALDEIDEAGMNALDLAIQNNKPEVVACLLAAGADVNLAVAPYRHTALITAVFHGHVEVVKMLLAHKGIALDGTDAVGMNALHWAAQSNKLDMVECLLAAGANVNLAVGLHRHTALITAASFGHVDVVKTLLAHKGIALDGTDAVGMTALHWAAESNKPDVAACLLAAGASIALPDAVRRNALGIAFRNKHVAVLEVLSHHGATLPNIDYFDAARPDHAAHAAHIITLADLATDQELPADPQQNPLGLVAPAYLEQPVVVIDALVAVLESGQDLQRWLRAQGIRMASALPVIECLAALAGTWPVLANNGQAATAQQKRLVCAAALSRLSVLAGTGEALQSYEAAGLSATGLERLSAVATGQIEKMIALSEQVLATFGSTMLDKLPQDCLAKTSFSEVDTEALSVALVRAGWLAPLAQAVVRAWTSALATLEAEPLAIAQGSTVKQITDVLRENIERKAPRLFAQAMQRELSSPALLAALRTWIGDTKTAEGLDLLFQIQCDQFRQYCEQVGSAG